MSTKSRKLRFLSLFWDYASALSLIALLVLLWHLGKGPIKVNFLRPYIIQALTNETSDYDLKVGGVNLELVHSVQPVKIIAKDVEFKDKEGQYLVQAPRLSLSFSARALLKGMLAPSSITIEAPKVQITTSYGLKTDEKIERKLAQIKDGDKKEKFQKIREKIAELPQEEREKIRATHQIKKLEFYFEQFEDFMERFNSPERLYLESFINSIEVTDASLDMTEVDTGQLFTFTDMDFSFERGVADILIKTDSAVKFEDRTSALDMTLKYRLLNDEVNYTLNFSDLVINDLYDILVPEKGDSVQGSYCEPHPLPQPVCHGF